MVQPVTEDDIGLKVLREPTAGATEFDIVAVHGIGAHPNGTWCKKVEAEDQRGTGEIPEIEENVKSEKKSRWVNWLEEEDMLPKIAPHARIMRYGYESSWFGEEAVNVNVTRVARRLLTALAWEREDCPKRPLIFVAHCFGGLVVIKALTNAGHNKGEGSDIFLSTTGLVFFGTPFRGAEGMKMIDLLSAARSEYDGKQIKPAVLQILQAGDEYLHEVVDQFGGVRAQHEKAQIACFFETKESDVGAIVGNEKRVTYVVSESSGCLDRDETTQKYPTNRTHFNMNKFGKPAEEDFKAVCSAIKQMMKSSHGLIQARQQGKNSLK